MTSDENTKEYAEGRRAYQEGLSEDSNPYPMSFGMKKRKPGLETRRRCWFSGYYAAQLEEKGLL
jgi:hypothetical protein